MNKRYLVKLDKQERKELSQLVKKERIAAKKRSHAQVLLLADAGKQGPAWKDEAIAEACQVTVQTVENIRKRLVLEGLELALNRKKQVRPSRAKILDGEKEAKVVALCCGAVPSGHARWTLRLLAERGHSWTGANSASNARVASSNPIQGPAFSVRKTQQRGLQH